MLYATAQRLLLEERARLTALRVHVSADVADDLEDEELSHVDQHPADVATELFEREKDLALAATVDAELTEVARALDRLVAGRYGRCEACGRAITEDRLVAVPATRFCVDHERDAEGTARLLDTALDPARAGLDRRDDRIVGEAAGDLDLVDSDEAEPTTELSAEEAALTRETSVEELEVAEEVDWIEHEQRTRAALTEDDAWVAALQEVER